MTTDHPTNTEKVQALLHEVGHGHIARRLKPNRVGNPRLGSLRNLTVGEAFKVMQAVEIANYGARPGWSFLRRVCDPEALRSVP